MRLILMTLSMTISALAFAWRTDILVDFAAPPATTGAGLNSQSSEDGLMAQAMAFIAGTPGGQAKLDALSQDINLDGTKVEMRNGILDQAAIAAHVNKSLKGMDGGLSGAGQFARPPAMTGSRGAKFVSVEGRN